MLVSTILLSGIFGLLAGWIVSAINNLKENENESSVTKLTLDDVKK